MKRILAHLTYLVAATLSALVACHADSATITEGPTGLTANFDFTGFMTITGSQDNWTITATDPRGILLYTIGGTTLATQLGLTEPQSESADGHPYNLLTLTDYTPGQGLSGIYLAYLAIGFDPTRIRPANRRRPDSRCPISGVPA
jgi:hypothetical protein